MFVRPKKSGKYEYLQVVENQRIDGKVRQRVIATLGRLDVLQATGKVDALLSSCARFAERVAVIDAHNRSELPPSDTIKIGPPLVFGRLWKQLNVQGIMAKLLAGRRYEFDVERAIFLTVLHRLMVSGSDRAAEVWRLGYAIPDVGPLELHHLYRAMAWLGEPLPAGQQFGATPFAPRCTKDLIEEALFAERRDLFDGLDLVFFDTTSIYFEGQGGATIGAYGYRKYLATPSEDSRFTVDEEKILRESRYDGVWVIQTDLELCAPEVALRYKELWMVEALFRTMKSILETRPVYHHRDETIRGHVFCSFLALVLLKELQGRMTDRGWISEWDRLKQDLDALEEITVATAGKSFVIRSQTRGDAGKAIQAAGIALGPAVRLISDGEK